MRIRLGDGTSVRRTPSNHPPLVVNTGTEPELPAVLVKLSNTARALTLVPLFYPELRGRPGLFELLAPEDHVLLARAYRFAAGFGLAPVEVDKLVADLVAYRAAQSADAANEPFTSHSQRPDPRGPIPSKLCALAQFSARDEALAQAISSSPALRGGLLDTDFMHQLLDPDRCPTHAVDFAFLGRMAEALEPEPALDADGLARSFQLQALTPGRADARDAGARLARREARAALASAVAELAPVLVLEPRALARGLAQGSAALIGRLLERPGKAPGAQPRSGTAQRTFAQLTRADRMLLRVLYAAAHAQGLELHALDRLAHALGALRKAERALAGERAALLEPVAHGPEHAPEQASERSTTAREPILLRPPHNLAPPSTRPSAPPDALATPARPGAAGQPALDLPQVAPGSASVLAAAHLAARSASAYGSLAPPPMRASTFPPGSHAAGAAPARLAQLLDSASTRTPSAAPFDLAGALGISALVAEVHARAQRRTSVRPRLRSAVADEGAHEHASDQLETRATARERQWRWLRLQQRRRARGRLRRRAR